MADARFGFARPFAPSPPPLILYVKLLKYFTDSWGDHAVRPVFRPAG
jgi:hypothetical protein